MDPIRHTLSKDERLHGKNDISRLLAEGKFGSIPGMKYCCRPGNGLAYDRVMVSVSKKFFKRAVKRNLLKRRIRESYRLLKRAVNPGCGMDILFIYNTKDILEFKDIYKNVGQIMNRLSS